MGKLLNFLKSVRHQARRFAGGDFQSWSAVQQFLNEGAWLSVTSSNVNSIHYIKDEQILEVEFRDGSIYQYYDISPEKAESFATASSKGGWVWSDLRRKGVPYALATWTKPSHPSNRRIW